MFFMSKGGDGVYDSKPIAGLHPFDNGACSLMKTGAVLALFWSSAQINDLSTNLTPGGVLVG